jgi:hypothetical protein
MSQLPKEEDIPQFVNEKDRYIEIYKITNSSTGKLYIGQTVSHMLNHGKYRRYGSTKRLSSHLSEAIKNNKDKECRYLNNSIRKYGIDKFNVELIDICPMDKGDEFEAKHITEYNSIFPFGYNLKIGGTVFKHCNESRRILSESYYKSLNKTQLRDSNNTSDNKILNSIDQNKIDRLDNIDLPDDIADIDKYTRISNIKNKNLLILKIGDVELSFGSKKKTNNELKQDIIIFIDKVKKYKSERNNFAKLPDVPETPHSNDNFADNNEHIASKDEYLKSIEIYKQHLKQKKEKKQFNFVCKICNIQKQKNDFRGYCHKCRPCEILANRQREKANPEKYKLMIQKAQEKNRDKINARRREQRRLAKLANQKTTEVSIV